MEKKLNVAVIGCGQIAKMHIPAVLAKKECNLYAICDCADDNRMQLRMERSLPVIHPMTFMPAWVPQSRSRSSSSRMLSRFR